MKSWPAAPRAPPGPASRPVLVRYFGIVRAPSQGYRRSVEQASLRPAAYLHHLPRWLPPVAIAALFIGGLAVPGWAGAVLLLVVAAFAGWLAYLSWPAMDGRGRVLRVAAVAVLAALAAWQAMR
jgi:Family of unknown function (DUF6703)